MNAGEKWLRILFDDLAKLYKIVDLKMVIIIKDDG